MYLYINPTAFKKVFDFYETFVSFLCFSLKKTPIYGILLLYVFLII